MEWMSEDDFGNEFWSMTRGSLLEPCKTAPLQTATERIDFTNEDYSSEEDSDGSVIVLDSDSSTDPCDVTFPVIKSEIRVSKVEADCTRSKIFAESVFIGKPCDITFPKIKAEVKTEVQWDGTYDEAIVKSSDNVSDAAGYISELVTCKVTKKCVLEEDDEIMILEEHLPVNKSNISNASQSNSEIQENGSMNLVLQNHDVSESTVDPSSAAELSTSHHLKSEILPTCLAAMGGCIQDGVKTFLCSLCKASQSSSEIQRNGSVNLVLENNIVSESTVDPPSAAELPTNNYLKSEILPTCPAAKASQSSSEIQENGSVNLVLQNHDVSKSTVDPPSAAELSTSHHLKSEILPTCPASRAFQSSSEIQGNGSVNLVLENNDVSESTDDLPSSDELPTSSGLKSETLPSCPAASGGCIQDGVKAFLYPLCKDTFPDILALRKHTVTHRREEVSLNPLHTATMSLKDFPKSAHIRDNTRNTVFSCSLCLQKFYYKIAIIQHMRIHTGDESISCSICSAKFSRESHLNKHMVTHKDKKPFSCSVCGKKFSQKGHLHGHMVTHTVEKGFSCSFCSAKFSYKSSLKVHVHKHTGKKPFRCSVCGKKFSHKGNFNRHMWIHTGETPFSCSICAAKFSHKNSLKVHFITHKLKKLRHTVNNSTSSHNAYLKIVNCNNSSKKSFSCSMCPKKFSYGSRMKPHVCVPTKLKSFSCSLCNAIFYNKYSLIIHIRAHTGEKPFSCSVCGKKISQKSHMNEHMRTHTGEKPFSCSICAYKCSQKSGLKSHILKHNRKT